MKAKFIHHLVILLSLISFNAKAQFHYPESKEIPVVDDYFGTKITDNYRWLENLKSDEVQDWFKTQSLFADSVMNTINGRDVLFKRMKELQKMGGDWFGKISQADNTFFYIKIKKDESLGKLYSRSLPDGEEQLIFDPEKYEKGSQIMNFKASETGDKLAVSVSKAGAEVSEIRILDVATKKLFADKIGPVWSEFPFRFVNNSTQLLYTKMSSSDNLSDVLLKNMKVCLHTLGTNSTSDKIIVSREKNPELNILPEQFPYVFFSSDKRYIFLDISSVKNSLLMYYTNASELNQEIIHWKPLINDGDEITDFITMGDQLFFLTFKNAPNFKIGVTNILKPDFENAKYIVPEGDEVIQEIQNSKRFLYYALSNGITQEQYQVNPHDYSIKKLDLPNGVNYLNPLNNAENDKVIVMNNGWLSPYQLYEYDAAKQTLIRSKWFDMAGSYPDYTKDFEVKEVEAKSEDGTMIPLSVIYPKNIKWDGSTPCYLAGYGAYGISYRPNFVNVTAAFLEQGCAFAFAHVRGGGEKGENWHKGGMKSTKANTWKDFIACAEYLENIKLTSPQKLIGSGMSAGGILIGRAITERPDLFAVAIAAVGVTNTVRSETTPNGPNQIPEIGSINNPEDAKYLIEMDAQSKVHKGVNYPAVFVRSGMNDPRVVPWEPGKFAAALQNSSASGKPVLLYVNYNNGHFTRDIDVTFRELSDMFAFSLWQVGHPKFVGMK